MTTAYPMVVVIIIAAADCIITSVWRYWARK